MRKIDYWLGVPLTFMLTVMLYLKQKIMVNRYRKPQRILLIELSEMGSTILADPLMQALKQEHNATLYFAIFRKNNPSLQLLDTVEQTNVFTFRDESLITLCMDCFKYFIWCRRNQIDTVVDLELFSRVSALLTGVSGAVNKVGFYSFFNEGLYRGNMLSHKVSYNPHIHIAKNFMALGNALKAERDDVPYSKTYISDQDITLKKASITAEEKQAVREILLKHCADITHKRLVLINPNASDLLPQRRWAMACFQTVIEQILKRYADVLIVITGSPDEFEKAQKLVDKVASPNCINFAGALSFTQLPALYSLSTVMLTNDSGPAHFAAITDMPSVVLFGPETPKLYGSLGQGEAIFKGLACSPCVSAANHRKTPCSNNVCLQMITTDEVLQAMARYL